MHHLVYLSQATHEFSPMELVTLLLQARDGNEQRQITGALVYGDGQFMQIIEGEQAAVGELYARIAQDPRHRNLFKLADKAITERSFSKWSMAFREISPGDFADLTGYVSPGEWAQLEVVTPTADSLLIERMRDLLIVGE